MAESYDQIKVILDDVCRQTAAKARILKRPELSIQPENHDLIKTFIDHGQMKISTGAGVIRGEYGENSPLDNSDPPVTSDPIVPMELIRALSLWVLYEWYTLVDETLGEEYFRLYEREYKAHRFTPGTASIIQRPYSPL